MTLKLIVTLSIIFLFTNSLFSQNLEESFANTIGISDREIKEEEKGMIKSSFDIDIITIPFKLRFKTINVQPQLNSSISGAIYVGYRNEYTKYNNTIALTIGAFSGIGNAFISPTTTDFKTEQEYDGIVYLSGLGGFLAFKKINFGILVGIDYLLDKNASIWIYNKKAYIGFGVGLNLN